MKKITLVLSALMLCVMMNAEHLVATLVHNGNVSIFYGSDAFVNAYNASVSGDVINLSAGTFNGCDIAKNITMRGAGWSGSEATVIDRGITRVKISSIDTVSNLYIEGIYFKQSLYIDSTLNLPYFVRCRISVLHINKAFNSSIVNCVIGSMMSYAEPANVSFVNCICYYKDSSSFADGANINFINCTIVLSGSNTIIKNSSYINCIFITASGCSLHSSCSAYNCVNVNSTSFLFKDCYGSNNVQAGHLLASLFVNPSAIATVYSSYSDSTSFELTEAAKIQYLGNDGTEVGIYGGYYPFIEQPSYPRIIRMDVDKKATSEGKLNVDVEVSSDEE